MLHATQHCHATLARVPSWEQRLPLWELCGCCSVGHSINMSAESNGHLKSESDISMISFLSHSSNHHLHSFHHFNFKSNHNNYCAKGAQKSAHKKSPPKRAGIWIIFHENHPILKEYSLSMLRSFLRGFSYLSQNAAIGRAYRDISCDPNWTRQKEMSPLLQRSRQYSGRDHLPKG